MRPSLTAAAAGRAARAPGRSAAQRPFGGAGSGRDAAASRALNAATWCGAARAATPLCPEPLLSIMASVAVYGCGNICSNNSELQGSPLSMSRARTYWEAGAWMYASWSFVSSGLQGASHGRFSTRPSSRARSCKTLALTHASLKLPRRLSGELAARALAASHPHFRRRLEHAGALRMQVQPGRRRRRSVSAARARRESHPPHQRARCPRRRRRCPTRRCPPRTPRPCTPRSRNTRRPPSRRRPLV